VLLADDHKIVRQGLAGLLEIEPDIVVVGEAEDGEEAVELARQLQPDVVIMDVTMPRMSGIEATRLIRRDLANTRVIGLSMHAASDMAGAMCAAGATAYLPKGGPSEDLIAAIRARK
jgi:DNA-binding NarL/FixJ family response regulator